MNRSALPLLTLALSIAPILCRAAQPNAEQVNSIAENKRLDKNVIVDDKGQDRPLTTIDLDRVPITKTQRMNLARSNVTDAALAKLKGRMIQALNLEDTKVSDAGVAHLNGLDLKSLNVRGTKITDAGLVYLKRMSSLRELWLDGTLVTDKGVKGLRQALPKCKISWSPPTMDERQSPAKPHQLR